MMVPTNTERKLGTSRGTRIDPVAEPESTTDVTDSGTNADECISRGPEPSAEYDAIGNDDVTGDPVHSIADSHVSTKHRRIRWTRVLAYRVLPVLVFLAAGGVGYLKWLDGVNRQSDAAAAESVAVASDTAVALLSYKADTAEQQLTAASVRLTGSFRDDYTKLVNDLVVPGARQKNISVDAKVTQAASVSATPDQAVVLLYVDQTTFIGTDPPTNSASAVLVTVDNKDGNWLVSRFDPV